MATNRVPIERSIKERFDHAVSVIRSLPKEGPFQTSNMLKLKFYGLFKQATLGINTTPKPGFWDPTARAKWEAWTFCGDMTSDTAMNMYIKELQQIIETMPQTKEVEEFLKKIAPFYEIIDEDSIESRTEQETLSETTGDTPGSVTAMSTQNQPEDNDQKREDDGIVSDSDDEVEFQDSYDNIPDTTPIPTTQSTRTYHPTPYPSLPPTTTTTTNSSSYPKHSSTPSLAQNFQSKEEQSLPSSVSLPSVITPLTVEPLSNKDNWLSPFPTSHTRREVRFSDTVTTLSDHNAAISSSEQQLSPVKIMEMIYQLQRNIQVLVQQFNLLVHVVNQQHDSLHLNHTVSRRRSLVVMFCHVLPLVSIVITSFLYNMINDTTSTPWWLNSIVTMCSVAISLLSSIY